MSKRKENMRRFNKLIEKKYKERRKYDEWSTINRFVEIFEKVMRKEGIKRAEIVAERFLWKHMNDAFVEVHTHKDMIKIFAEKAENNGLDVTKLKY